MTPAWSASHRVAPLAVAVAFFAGLEGLLFAVNDPRQAGALLFVVPIAILALRYGLRGGLGGAIAATVLVALWVLVGDVDLTLLGWVSRLVSYFLLGGLVGRFEDLARDAERQRMQVLHAREVQDDIVQALVMARYQLDSAAGPAAAQEALDGALAAAKEIVTRALGDDVRPGDLRLRRER